VNTWSTWGRRRWHGEQAVEVMPDSAAGGDVATEVAIRVAVRGALETLTDRQRTVVVLRIFDDLTEAQVARVLGCAIGTVKSTMSQALARLREDRRLAGLMDWQPR
jgi:DNA-directed RNA polymerase specialized sigma24 family protein